MRPAALIFSILTLGVLAVTFWLFMPSEGPTAAGQEASTSEYGDNHPSGSEQLPRTIDLRIAGGHRAEGPAVIQLHQGEKLRLQFTSDSDGELHLHGYDLQVNLIAGKTVVLDLTARFSGRFEYELHGGQHGSHEPLGVIEVLPR